MKFHTVKPSHKFSEVVRYYWMLEAEVSDHQPYIHRTLANSSPELIFHYKGEFKEVISTGKTEKSFLTGIHAQTDKVRRFSVKSNFGIFGVFLQPYAIPVLFGIPSLEIKNELPDLNTMLGQEGKDLSEKIMMANNNMERIGIINRFLEPRLSQFERPEIVLATKMIFDSKGQLNITKLADHVCLSQRQFERKFKEYIGFTPKTYSRIVRFNALLCNYKNKHASLTDIAYDFGYYDQAHFIRDFKQFSDYNPKEYFLGKAKEVFYAV